MRQREQYKHVIIIPATIAVAMLAMISCSSSKKTQTDTRTEGTVAPQIVPDTFVFPSILVLTEPSERISFLVSHFGIVLILVTETIQRPEITEQTCSYINFYFQCQREVDPSYIPR